MATNQPIKIESSFVINERYIKSIMLPFNVRHKRRIRECIMMYSYQYNLDPKMFSRLIRKESGFRKDAISHKDALGLGQIKRCWDKEMYYCRNGKFSKYLRGLTNKINHRTYYFYIGINLEMSARIIRKWLDKYNSLPLSMIAYNCGNNSDFFKACLKDPDSALKYSYVIEILELND